MTARWILIALAACSSKGAEPAATGSTAPPAAPPAAPAPAPAPAPPAAPLGPATVELSRLLGTIATADAAPIEAFVEQQLAAVASCGDGVVAEPTDVRIGVVALDDRSHFTRTDAIDGLDALRSRPAKDDALLACIEARWQDLRFPARGQLAIHLTFSPRDVALDYRLSDRYRTAFATVCEAVPADRRPRPEAELAALADAALRRRPDVDVIKFFQTIHAGVIGPRALIAHHARRAGLDHCRLLDHQPASRYQQGRLRP